MIGSAADRWTLLISQMVTAGKFTFQIGKLFVSMVVIVGVVRKRWYTNNIKATAKIKLRVQTTIHTIRLKNWLILCVLQFVIWLSCVFRLSQIRSDFEGLVSISSMSFMTFLKPCNEDCLQNEAVVIEKACSSGIVSFSLSFSIRIYCFGAQIVITKQKLNMNWRWSVNLVDHVSNEALNILYHL